MSKSRFIVIAMLLCLIVVSAQAETYPQVRLPNTEERAIQSKIMDYEYGVYVPLPRGYKNNPDKYELNERTISCRGGWELRTHDTNDHNQVHTYAVYLARLPYKEQLHWLQYNENPKGAISKRSFQTDFEAQYPDENPLFQQLQESLETLGKTKVGNEKRCIWAPKGGSWETASKGLHYVNSENANQWHDFIIALANATNEGFLKKPLGKIAAKFGNGDKQLGTLGLLKFILTASNNEDKIPRIHGVLNDLQRKRGKGKAHGTWDTPDGSLIEGATKILQNVILAINDLTQIVESIELPADDK